MRMFDGEEPAVGNVDGTTQKHLTCECRADQVGVDAMATTRATALKVIATMRLP
jgi:phage major head subunit gpT-like protein